MTDAQIAERSDDVEPELRAYLDSPLSSFPDFEVASVAEVRQRFEEMRLPSEVPEVAEVVDRSFPGPAGEVAVRLYRATHEGAAPALVWFHGGGWVLGDLDTAELPTRSLCSLTGYTVVSVDYRMAPEAIFPAAVEDCIASLDWVRSRHEELRIDPAHIVVGGDSAGGNLATVVALDARNRNLPLAGQLLVYPVTDTDFDTNSYREVGQNYGLTADAMQWFWDRYVPEASRRRDWRATPANADLADLSPALVITCGFDPLASEGLAYAAALSDAGVAVEVEHYPGGIHGMFTMGVDGGDRARRRAAEWLKSRLG